LGFIIAFGGRIAGHLFFAVMTTAYILIAIQFEERDLVRACGKSYKYREQVPVPMPLPHRGCERDDGRYCAETVLRSSWTAEPLCHPSAPGSIFASGMSARAAFLAATEIE
jgi:hypothetical protein